MCGCPPPAVVQVLQAERDHSAVQRWHGDQIVELQVCGGRQILDHTGHLHGLRAIAQGHSFSQGILTPEVSLGHAGGQHDRVDIIERGPGVALDEV